MTAPFTQYLVIKDTFCISYFGEDKEFINSIRYAKKQIELEFPGIKAVLIFQDQFTKEGDVPESKMADLKGKVAFVRQLEEKQDLKKLLEDAKLPIPEIF